jgi:NAD(P)-dependent dehydrogenase (short-subunit alcohol dehydrogenase family)
MELGLAGKVALVTGSSRGTGAGIARVLAGEGAFVLVHGFEPGQADDTVRAIDDAHGKCRAVVGDILTEHGTAALVAAVRDAVDRVDIVVNNYGVAEGSDWEASDTESWHRSYDANVVSAVRVTQAFLPDMRRTRWGRIVFVSTIGATRPGDRIPEYYSAKAALPSMAVTLAKHLNGSGITVNCVSPGIIATREVVERFTERARREDLSTDRETVERLMLASMGNPTGRVPQPEDVGRFVAFVASEPAWHLNGAHLRFDGGAADAVTCCARDPPPSERSTTDGDEVLPMHHPRAADRWRIGGGCALDAEQRRVRGHR